MIRIPASTPRERWRRIIFDHDTVAGRAFDLLLIIAIVASVLAVSLESLPELSESSKAWLRRIEWFFTGLFTVEYLARLWCAPRPMRYARSFFGVVDLASTLPAYIGLVLPSGRLFALLRVLRVLRVFRVMELTNYVYEAGVLARALAASRQKIVVFIATVLTVALVVGSLMYLIEGPATGFTSIPLSVYWAIVTLTTVGYGDLAPDTALGRLLASALMILGYGTIAVPTGIVTLEFQRAAKARDHARSVTCGTCGRDSHDADASFCKECGARLPPSP